MLRKGFWVVGTALGLALGGYAAQSDLPRDLLLLARIKQKMADNLSRLPT